MSKNWVKQIIPFGYNICNITDCEYITMLRKNINFCYSTLHGFTEKP